MPLTVNLRLLETEPSHVSGELPVEDFAADFSDPLLTFASTLAYELELRRQGRDLLVTGSLRVGLGCTCARCLEEFPQDLKLPQFAALATFEGEEALPRDGDIADLTPLLREDIYLALPTHPLCSPDCRGLARKATARDSRLEGPPSGGDSPWGALDRLKL